MAVLNPVDKFYRSIMEEVVQECREMFLDDGVDEIVLTELKQMWEKKVKQAKVFEFSKLHTTSSSFGMGSYGIISSSRNTCQEILVPSIQLAGPRGNGVNNNYTPTATIALPYGLYQQQISALNSAGISLQPSGNGQFLAFIRPDQQRLQSVTTQDAGKTRPIIVSTSNSVPIRPDAANLNRVSTVLPAKGGSDLKKQNILPTQTVFVGRVPNGSIAIKGTGNIGYSQPVIKKNNNGGSSVIIPANNNLNNESTPAANPNPRSTEQAIPNVPTTNIPIQNNSNDTNNVSSNIKTVPIPTTTTDSNINNTENLKTASNTSTTNNNNNSNMGVSVSSSSTINTFNASQNTYPPSNASSDMNATTQKPACDNSSLEALANICPTGFYNENINNSVDTRGQTGMVGVRNDATSLEDFMDDITNSNESYNYSSANSNSNMYNTQSFRSSTTDSSLPTTYKPATPGGQMCRFSEEDMQTIDEILQFDGAADDYTFEGNTNPNLIFYGSSHKSWPAENNDFYKVNNPKMIKLGSEAFYQNGKESIETKNSDDQNTYSLEQSTLHLLKTENIVKKDRLRSDYVARKQMRKFFLPISTVSQDSNQNRTTNDPGECYLETNIKKDGSSPENKNSQLSARNLINRELISNGYEKNPKFTKETPSGITVRTSSPTSNSSVKSDSQLVPEMKQISFIDTRSQKHLITSEIMSQPQSGFCSFPGSLPRQFDGEDADSSSSSDDNANANNNDSATDEDDDDDDDCEEPNEEVEDVAIESEPLNSADDDSDIDICAMFESENIVVCQFEKISRNKNKWKFHLKDGIMNLFGRDLIFSKSIGEAEW